MTYKYQPHPSDWNPDPLGSYPSCLHLPRLTLQTLLNLGHRALSLWAPDCSSWGIPCRGTSVRSEINPCGFEGYDFVARANLMISRNLGWIHISRNKTWWPMTIQLQKMIVDTLIWVYQPRLTLALQLVVSQCCFFLIEQPSQSLLVRHPHIDWFFNRVVWETWFHCYRLILLMTLHVWIWGCLKHIPIQWCLVLL